MFLLFIFRIKQLTLKKNWQYMSHVSYFPTAQLTHRHLTGVTFAQPNQKPSTPQHVRTCRRNETQIKFTQHYSCSRLTKGQHVQQVSQKTLRLVEDFAEVRWSVTHFWMEGKQKIFKWKLTSIGIHPKHILIYLLPHATRISYSWTTAMNRTESYYDLS